jgi:hypothetical protein
MFLTVLLVSFKQNVTKREAGRFKEPALLYGRELNLGFSCRQNLGGGGSKSNFGKFPLRKFRRQPAFREITGVNDTEALKSVLA